MRKNFWSPGNAYFVILSQNEIHDEKSVQFWKKAQNLRFLGSPTAKFFFDKLSIKKLRHTKNFDRDPLHRHFRPYSRKSNFGSVHYKIKKILTFWANHWRNGNKFPKNAILKKGHKISTTEGTPDRNFWWITDVLFKFC